MEKNDFIGKMKSNETNSKPFTKVKQPENVVDSKIENNPNQTDYINIYWDEWQN
ncbi:hypothetical protein [Alkalihalobacillus sp. BA299]|uniref:hypothetical protein n=1 Tax=Alkalihalobacillus sp. BA299 TaxID=2815938 RepID=UPI001ADC0C82|nr:hypothetical protein [Alkalihalobacillus sp. BA299]